MKTLLAVVAILCSVILSAQERITLLFVGDLMQHQAQIDAARTPQGTYDYSPCFSLVKEQIAQADIAIGNLEVTLGGRPYKGYPAFSAPDEYLKAIKDAGFDILLTANNHCLDRGKKGLERTLLMLDSLDIPHAGTYRDSADRRSSYPLIIEKKGFRIALLNYTYGTNGIPTTTPNIVNRIDKTVMQNDIRRAKTYRPDAIIACMHWGEEYQRLPNDEQRSLADWLLQQGVTHIIGSHPHVVQPMELRTNGTQQHVIAYSLGNFISNMSAPNTDGGLIFTLELEKYPLRCHPIPPSSFELSSRKPHPSQLTLYPYCKVKKCSYNLVWTIPPRYSHTKNFVLHPVGLPADLLPEEARKRLKIFVDNTRSLLQKHNIGIGENKK